MSDQVQEAVKEHVVAGTAVKVAPSVAVVTADRILGVTLNDWVLWATLLFILLQMGYLIWKWRKEWKRDKSRKRRKGDQD